MLIGSKYKVLLKFLDKQKLIRIKTKQAIYVTICPEMKSNVTER